MNTSVATRISPNITTMIRIDHSHVLALFHRYKADTPPNRKRALVRNACLAIQVHAQLEEEIFYPAMRNVLSGDEVLEKSEPEHQEMRKIIDELRAMTSGEGAVIDASCDEKFFALMRLVIHHVADEETKLLPAAERLLGDRLAELGMEMTRRRVELMRPYAGEFAANTVRSFPVGAAAGATLLTAGVLALGAIAFARQKGGRGASRWSRPGR
ncbi:MAG TPA: hemerythrin domain-containing protein [Steroidobacter sp.]|uniref:hemerythrin domain-containing protein n=1 Tax=Steroidobacter sp. TaxID=1978227 RepID=UPI002EDAEB9F